jgi:hypothetical protein
VCFVLFCVLVYCLFVCALRSRHTHTHTHFGLCCVVCLCVCVLFSILFLMASCSSRSSLTRPCCVCLGGLWCSPGVARSSFTSPFFVWLGFLYPVLAFGLVSLFVLSVCLFVSVLVVFGFFSYHKTHHTNELCFVCLCVCVCVVLCFLW